MFSSHRRILAGALMVVALVAGVGWVVASDRVQAVGETQYNLNLLYQIVNQIRTKYVDDLDEQQAIDAAIRGMLGTLDPYTEFLEKKQNDEMKMMQIEGKYGGLGIKITKQDDGLIVMALFDDTPAYNAGLQTGDRIVKIESQTTSSIDVSRAADLLRGAPGTTVTISVQRDGMDAPVDYHITRAIITIPVVPYTGIIEGGIGYIKLNQFTEEAGAEVERALKRLKEQGAQGVVFDLRGNPGGLLEQAVAVAGKFLDNGRLVVYTKGRNASQEKSYHSSGTFVLRDLPLVVLVDEYSASASEIVAGAIQDWDRGVVVGVPTFGKALVQQIFPMSDGTALKITTARYYTPSGRLIQKMPRDGKEGTTAAGPDSTKKEPSQDPISPELQFKTNTGRVVYGGGGIMPDFNVPFPDNPPIVAELSNRSLFIKFAAQYTARHPEFKRETFQVTDAMLDEFRRFMDDKEFTYTTEAEQALDHLETLVKKQPVSAGVVDAMTVLRGQLKKQHTADFETHRTLIMNRLGVELGAKLGGSAGRYAFAVKVDPQIQAAADLIRDRSKYNRNFSIETRPARTDGLH